MKQRSAFVCFAITLFKTETTFYGGTPQYFASTVFCAPGLLTA